MDILLRPVEGERLDRAAFAPDAQDLARENRVIIQPRMQHIFGRSSLARLLDRNPIRRDAALEEKLKSVSPRISGQTTMWRAGVGFHASHALGVILFGLVYGYLALVERDFLVRSPFLVVLGALVLLDYVVLAKLYWFDRPLVGVALALACYVAPQAASVGVHELQGARHEPMSYERPAVADRQLVIRWLVPSYSDSKCCFRPGNPVSSTVVLFRRALDCERAAAGALSGLPDDP